MSELSFWNKSDFDLKIACLGPLLVWFLVEIWSDKGLILRFLGLIFCLAALPWQTAATALVRAGHTNMYSSQLVP